MWLFWFVGTDALQKCNEFQIFAEVIASLLNHNNKILGVINNHQLSEMLFALRVRSLDVLVVKNLYFVVLEVIYF